jgi:hypothetical protein
LALRGLARGRTRLRACLPAHLWACRVSADMNHLTMDDPLYGGVEAIISAADFIEKTGGGAQINFS